MSENKIPVLFCTDGIFPYMVGGIQRHSRLLAEELAKTGEIDLTVIHPHENTRVFDPSLNIKEIILVPERSSGTYLLDCYRYSQQVRETALEYPDSVIYSQGLSTWADMRSIRNRVVLNPHGLEPFQGLSFKDRLQGLPFRLILRHQFKNSRYVVSLGGRLTKLLKTNSDPEKVIVLPNGVNVPDETKRNFHNNPVQFLFVGRFAFNKGIDVLCQAVKELNDEGYSDKAVFNLVGKGPLFDSYVKQYNYPNLHYKGFASDPDLVELYKTNDVFVLPTLFEGMPTVVLEAMAHGMPVIVTDTGATTEMVDASNGWIIEKKDVASLKSAIINYINLEAAEKKKLSDASYRKVTGNFTWQIVGASHVAWFRRLYDEMKKLK